jgi:hypothetical protein
VKALDTLRSAAASLTDALASLGERMPGLAQITISAGGVTATGTPKPPPATTCPHCGAPRG